MRGQSEREKNVVQNDAKRELMMKRNLKCLVASGGVMKSILRLSWLVVFVAQIGCGPKVSDVLSKYEGDFKKKREQFQAIAHTLPPKAAEKPCASMNPPIKFNENTKQYNTEILMYEQLLDPDAKPAFDMTPGGEL